MEHIRAHKKHKTLYKCVGFQIAVCVIIALISIFAISPKLENPERWKKEMETLDDYQEKAVMLSVASSTLSLGITLIPDDIGTPLAAEIVQLNRDVLFITAVLFLEQFLLTVLCYVSFSFLLPIAAGIWSASLLAKQPQWRGLAVKLAVFAIILVSIIPISLHLSTIVEAANKETFDSAISEVEVAVNEVEQLNEEDSSNKNFWNKVGDWFKDAGETITSGISTIYEKFKTALEKLLTATAVLIITICIIPILTWFAFLFLVKKFWSIKFFAAKKGEQKAIEGSH